MAFRFVHSADLHLDSPLRSLALRDEETASLVAGASRETLVRMIDLCLEEKVDALLLAGDLFDGQLRSMKTAIFFTRQMERLNQAGIRALIVRGNHDAASRLTRLLSLPDNVHMFPARGGSLAIEEKNTIIHGAGFSQPRHPQSLLPRYPPPAKGMINIGMMHTSLDGTPGRDPHAPCSARELGGHGYDYWALGHIHQPRQIRQEGVAIVMAGIPQGRHINESGAKSVTLATIQEDGETTLEQRHLALAGFERIAIELEGIDQWQEMLAMVSEEAAARRREQPAGQMIVRFELSGKTPLDRLLRRDRERLQAELVMAAERGAAHQPGSIHCEKLVINTIPENTAPQPAAQLNPLTQLRELAMDHEMMANISTNEFAQLREALLHALPAGARQGFELEEDPGETARLLQQGLADVLARLEGGGPGDEMDGMDGESGEN